MSLNAAVFALGKAVIRLTSGEPPTVGSLASLVRLAWRTFDNISICSRGCHRFHLERLSNYSWLVHNGGVGFTVYKRCDQRAKWALCQNVLGEPISGCIGVEQFRFVSDQRIADDLYTQLVQRYLLQEVIQERTNSTLGVVIRCAENVVQRFIDEFP